jgi:hypothetical protein
VSGEKETVILAVGMCEGAAAIKAVLPALTGKSYEGLEIDGINALWVSGGNSPKEDFGASLTPAGNKYLSRKMECSLQ